MDKMIIRDLAVRCIIGTRPKERTRKQLLIVNLTLECSLARAGKTDKLADTVNYKDLVDRITAMAATSRFLLIEKMAEQIAGICMSTRGVRAVAVVVDKPAALRNARSAAVEIVRKKR